MCLSRIRLAVVGVLLVVAMSLLNVDAIGVWAYNRLAKRFPVAELSQDGGVTGIIVLGGTFNGRDLPGERFLAGVRLAKQYNKAKVIIVGAGRFGPGNGPYEAMIAAGVAPERVMIETRSTNTFENALYSMELLTPSPNDNWILITSAYHMPRAVGVFRKAGFQIEAFPVDEGPSDDGGRAAVAFKEIRALIYFWALARSSSVFPGV